MIERHPGVEMLKQRVRHLAAQTRIAAANIETALVTRMDDDPDLDRLAVEFKNAACEMSEAVTRYRYLRDVAGIG